MLARGRDRHRQGARRRGHPPALAARAQAASSSSTAARVPGDADRVASCSATSAARSPAPTRRARAASRGRTAARCSSTRLASCRIELQPKLLRALEKREHPPRRRHAGHPRRRARHRRDQPRPRARGQPRHLPRGPLLPARVVRVRVPPLARARASDIPLLVEHFVREALDGDEAATKEVVAGITEDNWQRLMSHPWPGNVRELRNFIERTMAITGGVDVSDAPALGARAERAAPPSGRRRSPARRRSGAPVHRGARRAARALREGLPRGAAGAPRRQHLARRPRRRPRPHALQAPPGAPPAARGVRRAAQRRLSLEAHSGARRNDTRAWRRHRGCNASSPCVESLCR